MVLTVRFGGEWLMTGSGVRHVQGLWDSLVQSSSICCFIMSEKLESVQIIQEIKQQIYSQIYVYGFITSSLYYQSIHGKIK